MYTSISSFQPTSMLESPCTQPKPESQDVSQGDVTLHDLSQDSEEDSDTEENMRTNQHRTSQSTESTLGSENSDTSRSDLHLGIKPPAAKDSPDSTPPQSFLEKSINKALPPLENNAPDEKEDDPETPDEEVDWEFWSRVISGYDQVAKTEPQTLSHHVQRGVPSQLRGLIWQLFVKAAHQTNEYLSLLKEESIFEKAIDCDLSGRLKLPYDYADKQALYNIVKAYSLYDRSVGYCSSILCIATPLAANMPEEEAFCALVHLMKRYRVRDLFVADSTLLSQQLYQFGGLLRDHLPHIHHHFSTQMVHLEEFASKWFTTLFAACFPLDIVQRIFDLVLSEGTLVVFRLGLALLQRCQAEILSHEHDELVLYLRRNVLQIDKQCITKVILDAYMFDIQPKRLDQLAKEYTTHRSRASSEAVSIEELRQQNKQLADNVNMLESKLKGLNKEHAQVATQLIDTKMEIARIHDDNDALQLQSQNLKKALETIPLEMEQRAREEMEVLSNKNGALQKRNKALEDQLEYMESLVEDMQAKYTVSEGERNELRQRLTDLKRVLLEHSAPPSHHHVQHHQPSYR